MKKEENNKYTLDEEQIKSRAAFDGFLAISTNATGLSPAEVLDQYKQLFKIEHSFRTFKSHLEMRPMFHWTDKRIEGHICLCYIAFTLQHYVLRKLEKMPMPITEGVLRVMLDKMEVSLLQHNGSKVYLRSSPQAHEVAMQQKLGLRPLPPILPQQHLPNYL